MYLLLCLINCILLCFKLNFACNRYILFFLIYFIVNKKYIQRKNESFAFSIIISIASQLHN